MPCVSLITNAYRMSLTILQGFQWEPKQDNTVQKTIQAMNPENLGGESEEIHL